MLCQSVEMYLRYEKNCFVRPWFPPWWCTPTGGYSPKTILSHHHLENKRHNRDHFSLSSLQEAKPRNLKTFRLHYFYLFIMSVTYRYEISTQFFPCDLTSLTGCKIFLIWQQEQHQLPIVIIILVTARLCLRIWMNTLLELGLVHFWSITRNLKRFSVFFPTEQTLQCNLFFFSKKDASVMQSITLKQKKLVSNMTALLTPLRCGPRMFRLLHPARGGGLSFCSPKLDVVEIRSVLWKASLSGWNSTRLVWV